MPEPFVRQYDPTTDLEACIHVFRTTIHTALAFEPATTIGSYAYCRAYLSLCPRSSFVLDDGNGRAVGYVIGTADTLAFAKRWTTEFLPTIDRTVVPPVEDGDDGEDEVGEGDSGRTELVRSLRKSVYGAECSMLLHTPEALARYPAHLHIDIIPGFTGKGYGMKLIEAFLSHLKELGVPGVHLGMVESNHGARRFYERLGFEVCQEVLDGGESGEVGKAGIAVCLVKRL